LVAACVEQHVDLAAVVRPAHATKIMGVIH
jgi:hypothetical protein